jgi:ABC-type branched-subunit amino acid transport system ATPase component
MVFVGPSGCGKTTALRMVAGLEDITEGTIRIGDRVVNDLPPKDRDIAMVFQNYALYPHMTVEDNLAFGLQLRKTPKDEQQNGSPRRPRCWPWSRSSSASRPPCRGASGSGWPWAGRSSAIRRRT